MTLKRYEPRRRLRSGASRKQLESFLKTPDYSDLYRSIARSRKKRKEQQQIAEAQARVPSFQPSQPEQILEQELQKPAGGTVAEQQAQQTWQQKQEKKAPGKKIWENFWEGANKVAREGASLASLLATEKLPWVNKSLADVAKENPVKSGTRSFAPSNVLENIFQVEALGDLGTQMREKGVTYDDILNQFSENAKRNPVDGRYYKLNEKGELTKELAAQEKVEDAYESSDIGTYESVNDVLETGLNLLGFTTREEGGGFLNQLRTGKSLIASPYSALLSKENEAGLGLMAAGQAIAKGEPVPENFTRIPEMPKKLGLELMYDPLNLVELIPVGLALKGLRIKNVKAIASEVVENSKSVDGKIIGKVLLNSDEGREVIRYETIRKYVGQEFIPIKAGAFVGDSKQLGYTRNELLNLRATIEDEVINAKYFDQAKVKKMHKMDPDAPIKTTIEGRTYSINESERFLKQINELLVNDEILTNKARGITIPGQQVRYGAKGRGVIRGQFETADDIDLSAKNLFDTPVAEKILASGDPSRLFRFTNKLGESVKGGINFAVDAISPRLRLAPASILSRTMQKFNGRANDYLEASVQVHNAQIRSIPDLIEMGPAFAQLKRIGVPFQFNPERGIVKIGETDITPQLLKSLGIKVDNAVLKGDQPLILNTSDFIDNFFTTTGNKQYWRLLGTDDAGKAMLTDTGKWIAKYQRIYKERVDELVARGVIDPEDFTIGERGSSYISRIASELRLLDEAAETIKTDPKKFDFTKLRFFDEEAAQKYVAEGGRYIQDPFDVLRIFLSNSYVKQFDTELSRRVRGIDATKTIVDQSPMQTLSKTIENLDAKIKQVIDFSPTFTATKFPHVSPRTFNTLTNHFPELTEEILRLERLNPGAERAGAFTNLRSQIKALQKDPNSTYSKRLAQLKKVEDDNKKLQNVYGSYHESIKRDPITRITKKKLGLAERQSVEEFETAFIKAIKGVPLGKSTLRLGQEGLKLAENVGNFMRGIMANFDLASPLIQGQFVLARDPKAWSEGTKLMVGSLADDAVYYDFIVNHTDTIQKMIDGGIPLGSRTSDFFYAFQKGGRDSVLPNFLKQYFTKADLPGANAFRWAGNLKRQGVDKLSGLYSNPLDAYKILTYEALEPLTKNAKELEDLHAFIRHSTGSMDTAAMGIGQTQRSIEGTLAAFSPRLVRGMVALTIDAFRGNLSGKLAREAWAKLVMAQIIIMKELADVTGGDLNLDPTSSNFATVKTSTGTYGLSQTLLTPMKALAETAEISYDSPEAWKPGHGFWKTGWIKQDGKTLANPIARLPRQKAAPLGGPLWDYFTGVDFFGQESTLAKSLKTLLPLPFSVQNAMIDDINRATRDPDVTLPVLGEFDFYGGMVIDPLGVKQFPPSNWDILYQIRDEVTARRFPETRPGKPATWSDLSQTQRLALENPSSSLLENLTLAEQALILDDAKRLKDIETKVYDTYRLDTIGVPKAVNDYFEQSIEIDKKYNPKIEQLTNQLKEGRLNSSPAQFEPAMRKFKNDRKDILNDKYEEKDLIYDKNPEIQQYFNEQALLNPENTFKWFEEQYKQKVFFNPAFDLPDGEFDYRASKEAERLFFQNELQGNKELFDQIVTLQFFKKDMNEYEADLELSRHMFSGYYFEKIDQSILEEFKDVEDIYYNSYQPGSGDYKTALRDGNERLAKFITLRNDVRKNIRKQNPLLDAWVFRMGYDNTLLSEPFLISEGVVDPEEKFRWRDPREAIDWQLAWKNRRETYPGFYQDPN